MSVAPVEAILEEVKEGGVSAAFCKAQQEDLILQAQAIAQDEKGELRPPTEISDEDAKRFTELKKHAEEWGDYHAAAIEREKGDEAQRDRMAALAEMTGKLGIADPEKTSTKGDDWSSKTKDLEISQKGDSQFRHLFGNEEFHRWAKEKEVGGYSTPGKSRRVGTTDSFKLGSTADFFSSKSVISTRPNADNSISWDADGEFIGQYYNWGEVMEQRPEHTILGLFPVQELPSNNSEVRWVSKTRGTANVQRHQEVHDLDDIINANRKPFSGLGTQTLERMTLDTIAHLYAATTEAMDTWAGLEAAVNSEGRFELLDKIAGQLIFGDPSAVDSEDHIVGLFNQSGINVITSSAAHGGFAPDAPIEEKILVGRTALRKKRYPATSAILSAISGQTIAIQGRTYPSGSSGAPNVFYNPITGVLTTSIHGIALGESEEVGDDDIAMGSFTRQNCGLFTQGEPSVAFTDSHEDWFALNLVAFRFESKVGLALKRPDAFARISLNT